MLTSHRSNGKDKSTASYSKLPLPVMQYPLPTSAGFVSDVRIAYIVEIEI